MGIIINMLSVALDHLIVFLPITFPFPVVYDLINSAHIQGDIILRYFLYLPINIILIGNEFSNRSNAKPCDARICRGFYDLWKALSILFA